MAKAKRNIGVEILEGLREIKRGDYGRVINIPDVASIRERTGLSQARFAQLLGVSVRCKTGSRGVELLPAPQGPYLLLQAKIHVHCSTSPSRQNRC